MVNFSQIISKIGNKIPIIIGPTAVGKTSFSIKLAKEINAEIISVDSRQIYKEFIIGTAQPSSDEQEQVKHHLINCIDVDKVISAGKYIKLLQNSIELISKKGKTPIIVGGTMLYVNSLCYGIIDEADSNPEYRQKYFDQIQAGDKEFLINRLKMIDPDYAEKVSYNDHKKLVRALEIIDLTGKSPTEVFLEQSNKDKKNREKYFLIEINRDRENLRKTIHNRTIQMFNEGWVEEVQNLITNGISKDSHPMQSVGYKQIISFLNNEISREETIEQISTKTWQYAKKQLTWLKKMDIDLTISMDEFN